MPARFQLEIIGPEGDIRFYDLDPAMGVSNIGRHPDNDIVIDSPGVAPFHAVIDHRQRPFRVMLLTDDGETTLKGQTLAANAFQELADWDTLDLDGYAIILLEAPEETAAAEQLAPPVPVPTPGLTPVPPGLESEAGAAAPVVAVGLLARPPDQLDEFVVTELEEREWTVDVEQGVSCQVTIVNGGDLVATFAIHVEGLDESWVNITPPQINLYEGARTTVTISMEPPRLPSSTAGAHHMAIIVSSPNYPGRMSRLGATLTINPYHEFSVGDLSPKQQSVSWRKRTGLVTLPISNRGNSETPFRLEAEDDERACRCEFEIEGEEARLIRQAELRLGPAAGCDLPIYITPLRRRLVGLRKRTYSFTVTTALVEGAQTPRSVMGQIKSGPLIGPWLLLLMALILAVLVVIQFRPAREPQLAIVPSNPDPGQTVTLPYDARRYPKWSQRNILNRLNALFLDMRLEFRPAGGEWQSLLAPSDFEHFVGAYKDEPQVNGKYRFRANTWLSKLIPRLEGTVPEAFVFVTPVEPKIVAFQAKPPAPLVGQEVVVSWRVEDAEVLKLEYNGVEETLQNEELESGSRSTALDQDTTFTLIASNSSWQGEVRKPLQLLVNAPTKTPMPTPVIVRFDVDPLSIVEGDTVRISWQVTGADSVSIEPLGSDFQLLGDVGHQPAKLTNYRLSAILVAEDGTQAENSASKEVFVDPLPTGTPEPEAPEIQVFEAVPDEVILGGDQDVKLTWSVAGETTNIEITAPDLKLSGLDAKDTITVTMQETTLMVLTAYNGELSKSTPLEVTVLEPTPTEPPPPPTETPEPTPSPIPPPVIVFYRAEGVNPIEDKVALKQAYETENGWVYEYTVQAASMVLLSWKVAGAEQVTLADFGPQPAEYVFILPDPVLASANYVLTGQIEDPEYGPAATSAFVKLELVARPPPPPPYDLYGVETSDDDGKPVVALDWFYNRANIPEIDGFRVYRADVSSAGDGVFQPITILFKEDSWVNRGKYEWTDDMKDVQPEGRTCGFAYYATAFYWDIAENKEKETDASSTSYYTTPCD